MAIYHCVLAMRSQDHSQCSSHVVQGDLLPKIDDDIDIVLGLAVFYQYVRKAALKQQQTQYVVVSTTELFAHYLYIRCLSVMRCCQYAQMLSPDAVQRQTKYIIENNQLFIADVLLIKSMKTLQELNCHYQPLSEQQQYLAITATELDTSELVELLQESAVEHLTTYRQLDAKRFGSVITSVTTDFEALYAYKRGDYQRCLRFSTENVRTLLCAVDTSDVSTFPEFLQLMDDDIVSLTALTLIVNPQCREWSGNVGIMQLTLSLYLMIQCQLKLHHSVTSLAQTLDPIEVLRNTTPYDCTLDHLILKLTERKVMMYISNSMQR